MSEALATLVYEGQEKQVCWQGHRLTDNAAFDSFISNNVASRLNDEEGSNEFESHLRGLSLTGFGRESLEAILDADIPEERDWAVGEAIAEAWLNNKHNVVWPWNMERDKRNPKASLPGADLVGFIQRDTEVHIALGEVKTSGEEKYPPQVMSGRSGGMTHQIDNLAKNLGTIYQLLKWLWPRCKTTNFESYYTASVAAYFNSGNKAVSLFGVLIRDTQANELDLKNRGKSLGRSIDSPTCCTLIALYLPCAIAELPDKVKGGESS